MAVLLDSAIDPVSLPRRVYTQNYGYIYDILREFDVVLLQKKFNPALIFIFLDIK